MRKASRLLGAALFLVAMAGGCAGGRPTVRISSVHIDRAAIVLAKQGKEKNESVMEKIAGAIVPVAEVATVAMEPFAGLAVVAGHVAIALTEKGGDVGGKRFVSEVYHGKLRRMSLDFYDEGMLRSVVVEMAEEGRHDEAPNPLSP